VLIAAAGSGSRMGEATPKQFMTLAEQPVLQHVLQRVLDWSPDLQVVVVWRSGLLPASVDTDIPLLRNARVSTVEGGETRAHSVLNGLAYINTRAPAAETPVLVHDAARPLIRFADIKRLLRETGEARAAGSAVGGILATRVTDTIKWDDSLKVPDNSSATDTTVASQATLDREQLWQAQTPQAFYAGELSNALQRCIDAGPDGPGTNMKTDNTIGRDLLAHAITDEASAMEAMGHRVLLVEGSRDNIKITRPEDLALAAALLQQQSSPDR